MKGLMPAPGLVRSTQRAASVDPMLVVVDLAVLSPARDSAVPNNLQGRSRPTNVAMPEGQYRRHGCLPQRA